VAAARRRDLALCPFNGSHQHGFADAEVPARPGQDTGGKDRTTIAIDRSIEYGQGMVNGISVSPETLVAVDVHTHVMASSGPQAPDEVAAAFHAAAREYFGAPDHRPTTQDIADYYRDRQMAAVVFAVDSGAGSGEVGVPSEEVIEVAAANADVLIPFASVDPHKGKAGVREARRHIERGARGFKFHPSTQAFWPHDRAHYPLYEVIAEAGLVALFHSGQTGIGAGMPGGGGIRLKYSNPMSLDDVATDFPDLDIVIAHPSFPWQEEALAVATHKPRVHIDLSGWAPRYFPDVLVRYANGPLKHKVLFGSDFPLITPDRWLADFAELPIKDDVRPLVLKDNAVRLLKL
jgi:predicted TIM-barrel fold metal-dependent hydrolase